MTGDDLTELARKVGRACKRRRIQVVTAESCTGGELAAAITRISGSSKWFERGFVTYANDAKKEMLGVSRRTLERCGAVSEEVAREMARGALRKGPGDVSVAITGIAGPTGAAPGKPVGLVWLCWAVRDGPVQTRRFHFPGGREEVRMQSVAVALQGLIDLLR
jgi:nicotinamide-nucleotide amidase